MEPWAQSQRGEEDLSKGKTSRKQSSGFRRGKERVKFLKCCFLSSCFAHPFACPGDRSSSLTKKGADVDANTHSTLHQLLRGSVASVSASFKAEAMRKDPYQSDLYFPALVLFYRCFHYCKYTYFTRTRQNT